MDRKPRMMTIREIAREGVLSEHGLRLMLKAGRLPAIYIGTKALVNYDRLLEELDGFKANLEERRNYRENYR